MPTIDVNPKPVPTSWHMSGATFNTDDGKTIDLHILQFTTPGAIAWYFLDDAALTALVAKAQERLGKPRLHVARDLPPSNGQHP